jgi:YVTN family beta-propeller protein
MKIRIVLGCALVTAIATVGSSAEPAGTLVVLNKGEATASLIDLATGAVRATVATGEGPHEAVVSADGRVAVGADYGVRGRPGSSLTLIDVVNGRTMGTVDLGDYRRPHGLAWLPDGRLLVTAEDNRSLLVVDVDEGKVVDAVETGQEISHMVEVAAGGRRAFVANIGSGSVTVIDVQRGEVIRSIATGAGAEGLAVLPDGSEVWVTNRSDDTVTVIDAQSLEIAATIQCASFPIRAEATPDGRYMLVSCARSGEVAVFDVTTRKEVRRVVMELEAADAGGRLFGARFGTSPVPIGILVDPAGTHAWVANSGADIIAEVDLASWKVTRLLEAGREPDGMAYSSR